MGKRALIYGIFGQDGHYLSKLLSSKGYEVAGVSRKARAGSDGKIYCADLAGEPEDFLAPIGDFSPDEIYSLAGISSHREIGENPSLTFRVNAAAPIAMLQKIAGMEKKPRFFNASTAYIFAGRGGTVDEGTALMPCGIYGISKLASHLMAVHFRKQGLFACNGILFNHESPRRSEDFVTRKITAAAAAFKLGRRKEPLALGNLDAQRDWGYAGDYVEAMWLMLQQKEPDDYVIATGESHSVREFCQEAFSHVGLDWEKYVKTDQSLVRPEEAALSADISRARHKLGWKPRVNFKELVSMMVEEDLRRLGQGKGGDS